METLAGAASAPVVAGAGRDGEVYAWNVSSKELLLKHPTTADAGGVSLAVSPDAAACFVGTYYAWGGACIGIANQRERWRRPDLKRFHGVAVSGDGRSVTCWFDGKAGLTLDATTGESLDRHIGLRGFCASRFDGSTLRYGKQLQLVRPDGRHHRWDRSSFAMLACAFSPELCVVSESSAGMSATGLESSRSAWAYAPPAGAHVIELDYSKEKQRFVAIEYAYTEAARKKQPMVTLLHFDLQGNVVFRKAIRSWPTMAFCSDGGLLLNGLGELYDVATGDVIHVFEVPR